jgi:hypothetical protein
VGGRRGLASVRSGGGTPGKSLLRKGGATQASLSDSLIAGLNHPPELLIRGDSPHLLWPFYIHGNVMDEQTQCHDRLLG